MDRYDFEWDRYGDRYLVIDRKRGLGRFSNRPLASCQDKDDAEQLVDLLNAKENNNG